MPNYIPGISSTGSLAPGLSAATVRAVLELLSSAEIAAAYLPIAGGTMAGNLDMDHYQISNVQAIDSDEITLNGLPVASEQYASSASNLSTGTVPDARLSANVTLLGNATTGTGGIVRDTSPTLVTPNLGVATATSLAVTTITIGAGVSIVRNATGPTLETRAAGGLKVCNADGSAVAAIQCSSIDVGTIYNDSTVAFSVASNRTWLFNMYTGGTHRSSLSSAGYMALGGALSTSSQMLRVSPNGTNVKGVVVQGLASHSANYFESQNSAGTVEFSIAPGGNLTASGVAKFTGYPTGLLPAAASNAGSITYDTTLAKHVGCNGSSWNALW